MDKPIFNGLLHTGQPDLEALYRVGKIPMIARTSFVGWDDPQGLPTAAWYDAFATGVAAPRKIVMVDHEVWPYATQADRQATAGKYVTLYQQIKQRRPDLRIGWYTDPLRRDYWRAKKLPGAIEYKAWQSENNDLGAIMAPFTDVYFPSVYWFYPRTTHPMEADFLGTYIHENLSELKRIRRTYGRAESPIYPYVWWNIANGSDVPMPLDMWETMVRVTLDEADGMVLWGGYQQPWDENAPWWVTIKARLTDKRRTG